MLLASLLFALLGVSPVMHRSGGAASLDAEVDVALSRGRLEIHDRSGPRRYRSTPDMVVLGWAPIVVAEKRALLIWFLRRDENERGVVPHDSGWMSYGHTPWINHHLALLAPRGPAVAARWMSSGLQGVDAVWVDPPSGILLRSGREVHRFAFSGWQLDRVPGVAPALADVAVETGLLDIASVGDIMLGRGTARALDHLGLEAAFGEVRPWLERADLRVGNLESCFTSDETRPEGLRSFFAPRRHLGALALLRFDVVSLANNHCDAPDAAFSRALLMTQGIEGLTHTASARILRRGVAVEVLALRALPGEADGLMTRERAAQLERLARGAELVLVEVHWGEELSPEPTAEQRRLGAWLLQHGVAAVLGHHPHVVQPLELVSPSGVIAFSQGNFVFDQEGYTPTAATQRGAVVELRYHRQLGLTARTRAIDITHRAVVRPTRSRRAGRPLPGSGPRRHEGLHRRHAAPCREVGVRAVAPQFSILLRGWGCRAPRRAARPNWVLGPASRSGETDPPWWSAPTRISPGFSST